MDAQQIPLRIDFSQPNMPAFQGNYRKNLIALLGRDMDFHGQNSKYASHNFHSFPAKFPPQLPRQFITALTLPEDVVLDPMLGSGTTLVEAYLAGRRGLGFDIDPLALLLSRVKTTSASRETLAQTGTELLNRATVFRWKREAELKKRLKDRWDDKTRAFVDYWFAPETQLDLLALVIEIERLEDLQIKAFFELALSSIIITKSGGVSLAFDLAHTRPHRAKLVTNRTGEIILNNGIEKVSPNRLKFAKKTLRPVFEEFQKRIQKNLAGIITAFAGEIRPDISFGNAQCLPLDKASVDLIVTSPPYASNAIDYMRAHKFSLVWLGHPIEKLSQKRKTYIGGEATANERFEELPKSTAKIVAEVAVRSKKKGLVLHRYYSEMTRTLQEMFRVLKPGKAAIVVVGTSILKGYDTETQNCLADIGRSIGFEVPKIGVRNLDRNRRMMPAGNNIDLDSQIQQRMHQEYVIGFYKPERENG